MVRNAFSSIHSIALDNSIRIDFKLPIRIGTLFPNPKVPKPSDRQLP